MNFSNDELVNAVRFAHQYGVKVYVTVNTLAYDDDLPVIAEYLQFLSDSGVDAILVQDVGILSLAREVVPDLPLHASTQMTIHNTAGIRFAAEHGISRVVLARELPLADVKMISEWQNRWVSNLKFLPTEQYVMHTQVSVSSPPSLVGGVEIRVHVHNRAENPTHFLLTMKSFRRRVIMFFRPVICVSIPIYRKFVMQESRQ